MKSYPEEAIRKFAESLLGNTLAYNWLAENGYNELLILLSLIRGKKESVRWLMENKYVELAAFGNAVLGDKNAFDWLLKNKVALWALVCHAGDGDKQAVKILTEKKLHAHLFLAQAILKLNNDDQMGDLEAAHKFQG
ncbi:MAG TPA: hypothetical protein VNZ86_08915 [Bacteroidia bacterium]|jgi:hypothetical protein|nr:hypothetical protein [Bacteroidia bacterium]